MVRSISEERRRFLWTRLHKYIGENTGITEAASQVYDVSSDSTAFDRLLAFRYAPRCEEWRAALGRLEDGTYGTCLSCNKPISLEELDEDPLARFCHTCEAGMNMIRQQI